MTTNAQLCDLPIEGVFRSYRNAPTTWRIDRIDERVHVHDLFQVSRVADCSPHMSVWAIGLAPCADPCCPCETGEPCSFTRKEN